MVKVERDESAPVVQQTVSQHPPVVQAAIASTTQNLANVGFLAKAIKQEDQKPTSTLSIRLKAPYGFQIFCIQPNTALAARA